MSNLAKRSLSALILAPLVIYITLKGGLMFFTLVALLFFIMVYEWIMLTAKFKHSVLWWIFGVSYIGIACFVMLFLERFRFSFMGYPNIPVHLFIITALVWINDIFSYFVGRTIGGPKIAPKISPGKTWSGSIGGLAACVTFFFIMSHVVNSETETVSRSVYISALLFHIFVPIISLSGDLFESWIKRKAGVKDSGSIIPGHGGLLDRMDGLIMVMAVFGVTFFSFIALQPGTLSALGVK